MPVEAIRKLLAQRAAAAPDASAIAEVTLCTWQQVAARLVPVIGARGVDVLFKRALHLTSKDYPWLANTGDNEGDDGAALLAGIKDRLASREMADAVESSYALLVTFTELLSTMIGPPLTERLLGPVWDPATSGSKQESVACITK